MDSLMHNPCPIPLTNDVLPAPMGPFRIRIDFGFNFDTKSFPNEIVSDVFLRNTNTTLNHL